MSKFFFVVLCLLPPSLFAQSLLSPAFLRLYPTLKPVVAK